MQPWQSDPMDPFRPDPNAQWQAEYKSGRSRVWMLLGVLVLLAILAIGLGIFWVIQQNSVATPSAPPESLDQRIAATTAAYASEDVGVSGETLLGIERLLKSAQKAAQAQDDEAYQELIDYRRLVAYVKQNAKVANTNPLVMMGLKLQMVTNTVVDPAWQEIKLRHVDPVPNTNQFIVYTHCYDEMGYETDVRFWVSKETGSMKIGDWQRMDLGMRQSTEWALAIAYADDWRLDQYYSALDDLNLAVDLTENGDTARAETLLRRTESSDFPVEFQDMVWVLLGYQWNDLGDPDSALRCLEKVGNSAVTPGAHVARALAFQAKSDYEQAVEQLSRYEEVMGPTPNTSQLKADWLERLGRTAEVVEEWKKVLRSDPDDSVALSSLARLLDDSELDQLMSYLARAREPLEQIEMLANVLAYRNSNKGMQMLERFITESAPGSATAAYIVGMRLKANDELEAAAGNFLRALELSVSEDDRYSYLSQYLYTMVEANQVLKAYGTVEDKVEAFRFLIDANDEGDLDLTNDEVDALVDRHRQLFPEDASAAFEAAYRLREKGKTGEAIALLRDAIDMPSEDAWVVSACQYQLRDLLVRAGKSLEAYQVGADSGQDDSERFLAVAPMCRRAKRWDELKELMAKYRPDQSYDEQLIPFEAALLIQDGKIEEVKSLIQRMMNWGAEDLLDYETGVLWSHPQLWDYAYRQANEEEDIKSLTQQFAAQFVREARFEELQRLLDMHRERCPEDLTAASYHYSTLRTKDEYTAFADRWFPLRSRFFDDGVASWRFRMFGESLVRALLLAGRGEDALTFAQRIRDERDDHLPVIICHVYAGRVEEAIAAIDEHLANYGSVYMLYNDETVGHRLRSEEYASLHEKRPIELPYSVGEDECIILMKETPRWNVDQLKAELRKSNSEAEVANLDSTPQTGACFVVTLPAGRVVVSLHEGSYSSNTEDAVRGLSDAHGEAIREHAAWVSVAAIGWSRPNLWSGAESLVRDVALGLPSDGILAFGLGSASRMIGNSDTERASWAQADTLQEHARIGHRVELFQVMTEEDVIGGRAVSRAMRRLRRAFKNRTDEDRFEVAADLSADAGKERLWIRLEDITDTSSYEGQLLEDSKMVPDLKVGQRLAFDVYEITACRFEHAGKMVEAQKKLTP